MGLSRLWGFLAWGISCGSAALRLCVKLHGPRNYAELLGKPNRSRTVWPLTRKRSHGDANTKSTQ